MDKCREEFEKQKYWIGLFRDAVDFDEELGRYVLNGQRKLYAFHLDSFNEKWAIWQEAWQHQQAKVEEQAQEIANLKSLIQGHELRHQQNLSIKQKLTRRSEELQKRVASLEKTEFKLAQVKAILQNNPKLLESILVKKIEQALKGEG
ncbi:TPA: hypothetical protein JI099_13890 [Acinetobacter baumannii]|nr:hypothetical protein [Acinetobacter baumannii]